jgi:hypothetical protein
LVVSALRGLPVHLLSPIVEPLLVGKSIIKGDKLATEATLSILIKIETVLIICVIVIVAPLGSFVITTLGNQDFAPYGFILPILLIQALGTSYLRAAEILAGILQVHVTFMAMLPVSLLSVLLVYVTSSSLGFASLLIWPLFDTAAKLAIMVYALQSRGAAKIFDVYRLSLVIAPAALLIFVTEAVIRYFGFGNLGRVSLSFFAGVTFMLTLFVSRPFRRSEHRLISDIPVKKFSRIGSIVGLLAR